MSIMEEVPTLGVVVFDSDKVLLVQKKNHPEGAWQLPGGKIESGETLTQAAVRELHETTNLRAREDDFRILDPVWHATITKDYGTKKFSFRCLICLAYAGDANETGAAISKWVHLVQLDTLKLTPNTKAAILAAQL